MILEFFFLLKNDTYFFLIENFDTGQRKSGNFDIVPKFSQLIWVLVFNIFQIKLHFILSRSKSLKI